MYPKEEVNVVSTPLLAPAKTAKRTTAQMPTPKMTPFVPQATPSPVEMLRRKSDVLSVKKSELGIKRLLNEMKIRKNPNDQQAIQENVALNSQIDAFQKEIAGMEEQTRD